MAADAACPYIPAAMHPSALQDEDGSPSQVSFASLLTFSLTHVENLYTFTPATREFQFHYSEGEFMTRLKTVTDPLRGNFAAAFAQASAEHNGINYLGAIQVTHQDQTQAVIRLPGERTYDPASSSDSETSDFLDCHSFHFLTAVTAAKVMAAKCGADLSFIRDMHRTTKAVMDKYHHRLWFNEWMQFQVEKACFERIQPIDYTEFLSHQILQKALIFKKDHSKEFLASQRPPQEFYQALLKNEDVRQRLQADMGTDYTKLSRFLEQEGVAASLGKRLGLQQVASHEAENERQFESEAFSKEDEERSNRDPTFAQIKAKVKALEQKYLEGIRAASGNPDITLEKPLSQQCVIS